jgi:hypothetical protein
VPSPRLRGNDRGNTPVVGQQQRGCGIEWRVRGIQAVDDRRAAGHPTISSRALRPTVRHHAQCLPNLGTRTTHGPPRGDRSTRMGVRRQLNSTHPTWSVDGGEGRDARQRVSLRVTRTGNRAGAEARHSHDSGSPRMQGLGADPRAAPRFCSWFRRSRPEGCGLPGRRDLERACTPYGKLHIRCIMRSLR